MEGEKEKLIKAIEELEEFFLCDLPTKVYPQENIKGNTWVREDHFKNIIEVKDYIEEHFQILYKQIKAINGK